MPKASLAQVDDLMLAAWIEEHMATQLVDVLARVCGGVGVESALLAFLQAERQVQTDQARGDVNRWVCLAGCHDIADKSVCDRKIFDPLSGQQYMQHPQSSASKR